jgi:hypothetical protein
MPTDIHLQMPEWRYTVNLCTVTLFILGLCILLRLFLSRLLQEPSFATTFQGVYFIFFAATCLAPVGYLQAE